MSHHQIGPVLRDIARMTKPLTHAEHASLIGVSIDTYRSWIHVSRGGRYRVVDLDAFRTFQPSDHLFKVEEPLCCRIASAYQGQPDLEHLRCPHIRLAAGALPHGLNAWCNGTIERSVALYDSLSIPSPALSIDPLDLLSGISRT